MSELGAPEFEAGPSGGPPLTDVAKARQRISEGNPWYTCDQFASCGGTYRHNMAERAAYVERNLRGRTCAAGTVLDIGCGDGYWSLELLRTHQPRLVGMDYSPLRLERYRHNVPVARALLGTCVSVPLRDETADLIMMHQVLEHIPQPSAALAELRRVVKRDGTLLISVPNEGTWLKRLQYRWLEPQVLSNTDHVNFFTKSSLRHLLEANGFRCQHLDTVGFFLPHTSLSRRVVGHRRLYRLGVAAARIFPALRDCIFAWCRPAVAQQPGASASGRC